jgi:hypothetical protein
MFSPVSVYESPNTYNPFAPSTPPEWATRPHCHAVLMAFSSFETSCSSCWVVLSKSKKKSVLNFANHKNTRKNTRHRWQVRKSVTYLYCWWSGRWRSKLLEPLQVSSCAAFRFLHNDSIVINLLKKPLLNYLLNTGSRLWNYRRFSACAFDLSLITPACGCHKVTIAELFEIPCTLRDMVSPNLHLDFRSRKWNEAQCNLWPSRVSEDDASEAWDCNQSWNSLSLLLSC